MLRVSVDGGVTWNEVSEVRVEAPVTPEDDVTLTLTMTEEGVIRDTWNKEPPEECVSTGCTLWDDLKSGDTW